MRLIDGDKVEERLILLQANCERKPSQLTSAIWGALEAVREFVKEQPIIEPVNRGKWVKKQRMISGKRKETLIENGIEYTIEHKLGYYTELYCSECGAVCSDSWNNFCGRCGAKMESESE